MSLMTAPSLGRRGGVGKMRFGVALRGLTARSGRHR